MQRGEPPREVDGLPGWLYARLRDADVATGTDDFDRFLYASAHGAELHDAWVMHSAAVMADWVRKRPGTRPSCWWTFDAPRLPRGRWPGWSWDGALAVPRLRLGGQGTPAFEVLAYVPEFAFGMPVRWVDDWSIAYYTGRARDVHGKLIGAHHVGSGFSAQRFDPADPPRFESQAAYLERHGLLRAAEARRLRAQDLQPEALLQEFWPTTSEERIHHGQ